MTKINNKSKLCTIRDRGIRIKNLNDLKKYADFVEDDKHIHLINCDISLDLIPEEINGKTIMYNEDNLDFTENYLRKIGIEIVIKNEKGRMKGEYTDE